MIDMKRTDNGKNPLWNKESERVIYSFNNTKKAYDKEKTLHKLFEEQAEKSANKVAAVYKNQYISYGELNRKANQLAKKLREYGVRQNDVVGLMVNRSIDMLIGIIGILKAGGCYLPIDPSYAEVRIHYMLKDSGTRILLTQENLCKNIDFNGRVIGLDDKKLYTGDCLNIDNINVSGDLAYVIYTSGSTGKPKGVMLEHRAVHNFILGVTDEISFSADKTIVCLTTISFDIFILESLLPLSTGMKIIISDPMQLSKYLSGQTLDMLQTTPSTMKLILNDETNLKYIRDLSVIMIGGEEFPKRLLQELKKHTDARIYNMYGPTETTVWSTIKEMTHSEEITIGKPIANTQIYIVDESNNLLTIDETGELCIAGDGVARGYLNKTELTNERFVENPVAHGSKMYKTGDMAKWLTTGEIEFLGRKDCQVKVRGFRVELGEIEECLGKYEKVKECVVAAKINESEEKYLVAYYLSDEELVVSDIISFLGKSLPEYMIPRFYMRIDKIPLTPNCKIDRNSLPIPDTKRPNLGTEYVAPQTKTENHITDIWRCMLNREIIGMNDNFFEIGGNSILASQMHIELEKHYPGKINLCDVFSHPSISKLGKFIGDRSFDADLYNSIQTLRFPNEYYAENSGNPGETVLNTKIENVIGTALDELAKKYTISVYAIFLAVYMHLLSELSNQSEIEAFTAIKEMTHYKPVRLDFADTTDLIALCEGVGRQIDGISQFRTCTWDDFNRIILREGHLLPTFYFGQNKIKTESIEGELALVIKRYDSGFFINIASNSVSLRKSKLESLLVNYVELLKAIVEAV